MAKIVVSLTNNVRALNRKLNNERNLIKIMYIFLSITHIHIHNVKY